MSSLLTQTYKNIEIILVDDASSDDSWSICERYANENNNVFAFRKDTNSGAPLRSRERGIVEAHGEWITFMDCDDYVKPEYIEHLVEATQKGKYDIAVTGYSRLYPDGRIEDFLWGNYRQNTKERLNSFFKHYFIDRNFWTDPSDTVGQNLVRASLAKKTDLSKYPDMVWGEDSLMALAFQSNSKNGINFVDHHDFLWRQVEGSGSHGGFSMRAKKVDFYKACFDIFNKNKMLPLVSVIVPIFKVENHLRDCLNSIVSQTYPNIEIILVDDKTPDSSGDIADEYATKDSRIKVIHKQENEGLNSARATGFMSSSGEYVLFVDSDDLLDESCVEISLATLLREGSDFVRFSMKVFENKNIIDQNEQFNQKLTILDNKKSLYMTQFNPGKHLEDLSMISMTVWGAIYTKKLVDKVDWKETNFRVYEDNIWTLRLLENASKGVFLGYIGYYYRNDDTQTDMLSKRLVGNSINGRPIGYMEFWKYLWSEYRRYNKKYKIGAEDVIDQVVDRLYLMRAGQLTEAHLWNVEGNAKYLPEASDLFWRKIKSLENEVNITNEYIKKVEHEKSQIIRELNISLEELKTHLSVKRSLKLSLGNVKRYILRIIKRI